MEKFSGIFFQTNRSDTIYLTSNIKKDLEGKKKTKPNTTYNTNKFASRGEICWNICPEWLLDNTERSKGLRTTGRERWLFSIQTIVLVNGWFDIIDIFHNLLNDTFFVWRHETIVGIHFHLHVNINPCSNIILWAQMLWVGVKNTVRGSSATNCKSHTLVSNSLNCRSLSFLNASISAWASSFACLRRRALPNWSKTELRLSSEQTRSPDLMHGKKR